MPSTPLSPPLRVLFLANYAPVAGISNEEHESVKYTQYHQEMFSLLEALGFYVTPSRDVKILLERPSEFDYVFSLLNRAPYRGSEILVSAVCEYFRLPYLGARPHVRAVAEDKHLAKIVAMQLGFKVPRGKVFRTTDLEMTPPNFPGPFIAKPRFGASSKHITEDCIQEEWSDLIPEVHRLLELGDDVLVEEWMDGMNISLPLIGGNPPLILPGYKLESDKKGQLVTYEQKRGKDRGLKRTLYEDQVITQVVKQLAVRLYLEVAPIDYLRIDFRIESNKPVFLEFNVCCNIGPQSGFYACAKEVGLSHQEMLVRILGYSLARQKINWQAL